MRSVAYLVRIAVLSSLMLTGCQRTLPPSFLLVVLDTTRADAVSAYGSVSGTTPALDRLAASGIRYSWAFANANWTLPSHVTLFTGLHPSVHRVRQVVDSLPSTIPTLAEHLRGFGYETRGVTENIWIGEPNGVDHGFDWTVVGAGQNSLSIVKAWLERRDRTRPFLLFVNLFDAHLPYLVRSTNPFLPDGVTAEQARAVSQDSRRHLCLKRHGDPSLETLRGLYLGDVRAADAKLATLLQLVRRQVDDRPLVTIVTSDHGEYFGETGLVLHDIGIGQAVTHVPLVVHGLRDIPPAIIETPVQLADVMPSILDWAGMKVPAGLSGQVLPVREASDLREPSDPVDRAIVADYADLWEDKRVPENMRVREKLRRKRCDENDRISGDRRAVIRFPYELMWYGNYERQLFDVRADPSEDNDILASHPEVAAMLSNDLARQPGALPPRPATSGVTADRELVERLRALGYLGGVEPPAETAP